MWFNCRRRVWTLLSPPSICASSVRMAVRAWALLQFQGISCLCQRGASNTQDGRLPPSRSKTSPRKIGISGEPEQPTYSGPQKCGQAAQSRYRRWSCIRSVSGSNRACLPLLFCTAVRFSLRPLIQPHTAALTIFHRQNILDARFRALDVRTHPLVSHRTVQKTLNEAKHFQFCFAQGSPETGTMGLHRRPDRQYLQSYALRRCSCIRKYWASPWTLTFFAALISR